MKGGIYFISDASGLIKIGQCSNIHQRMASLQTANPRRLELIHFINIELSVPRRLAIERAVHRLLGSYRRQGEWFEITREMARIVWCKTEEASRESDLESSESLYQKLLSEFAGIALWLMQKNQGLFSA